MSKPDPTAEQLNDLLDELLSPPELARMRGPAAAEARAALAMRQALKDLQPDGAFFAQLEAQLVASKPEQNAATWRQALFGLARLRRAVPDRTGGQATPFGPRRAALAISGIAALLALVCAAVVLLSLLGRNRPAANGLGALLPLEPSRIVTNTGLSSYVLSDMLTGLPAAPSRVPLFRYFPKAWDAGTTRQVAGLARSLGLRDPFTVTLDETAHYTVTDGTRYIIQYRDLIAYVDSSVRGPGSGSGQAGARPSFSETEPLAEAFLKAAGFVNFPFRAEQGDPSLPEEVHFVRLADGRPVQSGETPFDAQVDVVAGRILYAGFISRTLAPAGEAAIIGADEAWQMLQQNRLLAFRTFTVATQPITQIVSTPQAQPAPTGVAPVVDAEGNVNGIEGRLSAIISERIYTGTVASTRRIDATLSEWRPGLNLAGGWIVTLTGTQLSDVTQYDGLRMKVWGHYDAALRTIEMQRFVKGDSSEHRQAWLGMLTNTLTEDGVTRSFFTTKAGQRFIVSVALPCDSLQTVCELNVLNAPTDRIVIMEGAVGQETYQRVPVLAFLGLGGGMRDMTESDLANVLPRPHVELQILGGPLATGGPAPTSVAPVGSPRSMSRPRPVASGTVDQVELVYYSHVPLGSITGTVTLRPAWRFRGYASDGQRFEALVDALRPNITSVTLDAFSGRPNPSWTLDGAVTSELQVLLATAAQTATATSAATDGALGYRGMLVDITDATTGATEHFRVFNAVVAGQGTSWADPQRHLERWLLRSGAGWFDNDLYSQLSQQIDSALPQDWKDVASVTYLSAEMPKPYQLRGVTFFLILVGGQPVALSAQDPHPRGCLIRWGGGVQRLTEPCLGSYYDLHGAWMGGPSPRDMDRYPARLNGTRVEVDVTRVIDGAYRAQRQPDGSYSLGATPTATAMPAVTP